MSLPEHRYRTVIRLIICAVIELASIPLISSLYRNVRIFCVAQQSPRDGQRRRIAFTGMSSRPKILIAVRVTGCGNAKPATASESGRNVGDLRHISEVLKDVEPREVELPVCPTCGRVGLQPVGGGVKYACTGGMGADHHKRVSMVRKTFREVAA